MNDNNKSAVVACQGTEGANSQRACETLFTNPETMYFESFDAVFNAVDKDMCEYGILPLENSLHGSVTEVYDLMRKYRFYIVKSVKVRINHALLSNHGAFAPGITEIYSHEQALAQCVEFIKNLKNVKVISCANTAVAARTVAESGRTDIAAIADSNCADLYNLSVISRDIQNNPNNFTRFICISKKREVDAFTGRNNDNNRISVMFTVAHKPGSLYEFLGKFAEINVNLTKLESRPIPGSDFEFMFYAEMEISPETAKDAETLIKKLSVPAQPETFLLLGNYSEELSV